MLPIKFVSTRVGSHVAVLQNSTPARVAAASSSPAGENWKSPTLSKFNSLATRSIAGSLYRKIVGEYGALMASQRPSGETWLIPATLGNQFSGPVSICSDVKRRVPFVVVITTELECRQRKINPSGL